MIIHGGYTRRDTERRPRGRHTMKLREFVPVIVPSNLDVLQPVKYSQRVINDLFHSGTLLLE